MPPMILPEVEARAKARKDLKYRLVDLMGDPDITDEALSAVHTLLLYLSGRTSAEDR